MKIKILLMPIMIIIAIYACVWLVYPVYSNGVDGFKENSDKLKKEESKIVNIKDKISSIENLSSQISNFVSERDVVYNFIPEKIKEENVVKSINSFSDDAGLSLYIINPQKENENSFLAEDNLGEAILEYDESGAIISQPIQLPQERSLKLDLKLVGGINDYEKIKVFFEKLNKLESFNAVRLLDIKRNEAGDNEEEYFLEVLTTVDFFFADKPKIDKSSYFEDVFSFDNFSLDAIQEIRDKRTQNVPVFSVGKKGRVDIFNVDPENVQ